MKIYVINVLEFETFNFFEEYFLNLGSLKSVSGALANKTIFFNSDAYDTPHDLGVIHSS